MRGTIDLCLVYDQSDCSRSVTGYVDSNYARDLDRRRSLIGYVFKFANSAISWKVTM